MPIDISDRDTLFGIISNLQENDLPQFGAMTPRHMIEHLAFTVRFSNGKDPQQRHYREEKEQKIKAFVLGTDLEMPEGFKSPVLDVEILPELRYTGLSQAVAELHRELDDFDAYFSHNPEARPVNPTMGELSYAEWMRFHNRHFAHHFRQFRLKIC